MDELIPNYAKQNTHQLLLDLRGAWKKVTLDITCHGGDVLDELIHINAKQENGFKGCGEEGNS